MNVPPRGLVAITWANVDRCTSLIESSGNVFADIGLPNPEERLAKAELARQIRRVIAARDLTQAQAAMMLGIAQPNVSNIVNEHLNRFSIERLMDALTLLDQNVEIVITPKDARQERGEITVAIRA